MFVNSNCGKFIHKSVMVPFVLNGKTWNLYAYVINKGTCVFKGTSVPLHVLANNTHFYVSNKNTAGGYAQRGGYACTFISKQDHIVIVLNKTNMKRILDILTYLLKTYSHDISIPHVNQLYMDIRQAYGIKTTKEEQYLFFKIKNSSASNRQIVNQVLTNKKPGRVSFATVDKRIMKGLEWLFKIMPNIQGVYSAKKHSPAHGGKFHPELAYFKASNVLQAHGCKKVS